MNIELVNDFIGKDWIYKENDCWAVVRKAALAVFEIHIHEIKIPDVSDLKKNETLFDQNSKKNEWSRVLSPAPSRVALFRDRRGRAVHIGLCISAKDILHCVGTPERPGTTKLDQVNVLKSIYGSIEYYEYIPDNRN
jgi:hypothetical protein